jgi:protein gp37
MLLNTPAKLRWVSAEPLLEPINLLSIFEPNDADWEDVNAITEANGEGEPQEFVEECEAECDWVNYGSRLVTNPEHRDWARWRDWRARTFAMRRSGLKWIVVGGESGPEARPCQLDWIRSILNQCDAAEVPVFVKQLGSAALGAGELVKLETRKGGNPDEWPEDLRVRQYPEVAA